MKFKQRNPNVHVHAAIATIIVLLAFQDVLGTPLQNEEPNALYDQCVTEDSDFAVGSCMLSQECDLLGGTVSGTCAEGLGACCIVKSSCGSDSTLNNTYFINPDSLSAGACHMTINRAHEDICQIRLDFVEFQLSQPDVDGRCVDDFLTLTGEMATEVPTICGSNNGHHMYVDVVPKGGSLELIADLGITSDQSWRILVQQIACDSKYKAPEGCLQYYTETSGTVQSFNFNNFDGDLETNQLANQNYGACIKKTAGYCGIVWERNLETDYSFTVSQSAFSILPDLIGNPEASSKEAGNCPYDFVIIPGGVDDTGIQADRYCGLGFPNTVTSTLEPFVIHVRTNNNETPDDGNFGFKLDYRQINSC